MFCLMFSVLRRPQNLPTVLKGRHFSLWHCQQFKQSSRSSKIYGKFLQKSSGSVRTANENKKMWPSDEQAGATAPNTGQQQARSISTTEATPDRFWVPYISRLHTKRQSETGIPIKIISYNILAQDLLLGHMPLYKNCNPMHLKWSYRLPRLVREIVKQNPDIICLQEVQANHLNEIASNLKSKIPLAYLFKRKTGFQNDGCAIFYNKNNFDLVDSDVVEYYQPGFEPLDRHNIAVIAKLRSKANPAAQFLVSTTHLLYNPRRQDVRLAQTMVLLAELDRLSVVSPRTEWGELQRIPIILTGDFNFTPKSAPFELISKGTLNYDNLSRFTLIEGENSSQLTGKGFVSSQLGITDRCQHIDCVQSQYNDRTNRLRPTKKISVDTDCKPAINPLPDLFSTGTLSHELNLKSVLNHAGQYLYGSTFQKEWVAVDHVFYSVTETNPLQPSLDVLSVYELPSVQQCATIGQLPNSKFPSDHLILGAKFYLRFPDT